MTSLTNKQIHDIGEWCAERGMLPHRIDAGDIKAACQSLRIVPAGDLAQCDVEAIAQVCEAAMS
jgi:hypothetical protein